jgi:hypothetical protein
MTQGTPLVRLARQGWRGADRPGKRILEAGWCVGGQSRSRCRPILLSLGRQRCRGRRSWRPRFNPCRLFGTIEALSAGVGLVQLFDGVRSTNDGQAEQIASDESRGDGE